MGLRNLHEPLLQTHSLDRVRIRIPHPPTVLLLHFELTPTYPQASLPVSPFHKKPEDFFFLNISLYFILSHYRYFIFSNNTTEKEKKNLN